MSFFTIGMLWGMLGGIVTVWGTRYGIFIFKKWEDEDNKKNFPIYWRRKHTYDDVFTEPLWKFRWCPTWAEIILLNLVATLHGIAVFLAAIVLLFVLVLYVIRGAGRLATMNKRKRNGTLSPFEKWLFTPICDQ